jgi:hypothetical protein
VRRLLKVLIRIVGEYNCHHSGFLVLKERKQVKTKEKEKKKVQKKLGKTADGNW